MTQFRVYVFIIFVLSLNFFCKKEKSSNAQSGLNYASPEQRNVLPGVIDEVSGIVASASNPNHLWAEMDGGNSNDIYLLSNVGEIKRKVNIKAAINRDWEDMSFSPANGLQPDLLYLADIGDNGQNSSEYSIYRFAEPKEGIDTVDTCDKIRFKYADGSHDAEALLVDPSTLDVYIFTKRDDSAQVYRLSYPQDLLKVNMATRIATLGFTGVVGAGMSTAGDQILIKTYTDIYYWKKASDASIDKALKESPMMIPYQPEVQGEAICFGYKSNDFYTLSERPSQVNAIQLRYYKRQ